ncbi:MAG: 2-alkenal reductase, partial [Lentisphaeria bacterium]
MRTFFTGESGAWRLLLAAGGSLVLTLAGEARAGEAAAAPPPPALAQLEDAFTAVAEKAFPAVVVITNQQAVPHG